VYNELGIFEVLEQSLVLENIGLRAVLVKRGLLDFGPGLDSDIDFDRVI